MDEQPRTGRPLRVGVMLDDLRVPAWVAKILRELEAAPYVDLRLLVVNAEEPPRRSLPQRFWRNRHRLLFKLYERLDDRVYSRPDDAFTECDVDAELAHVPRLRAVPLSPRPFEHRFDAAAIERIRDDDLDVMLRFGFNIIRGDILQTARYGVWSFHHGDNRLYRGGPAFFWEMYERNLVSGTTLQILTEELDGGQVIYRSFSATDPVSLRRSRNGPYWKSANFITRRLRGLHEHGSGYLEGLATWNEEIDYRRGIYRTPTNRKMLRFAARVVAGILRRRLKRLLFRDEWVIAYRHQAETRADLSSPPAFRVITPPRGRFYADPFVMERDGRGYIFFEDFSYETGKGAISCVSVNGSEALPQPSVVLERDYHVAYPFLFEWEDEVYMIPETSGARSIELYRASSFPDRWELVRVLMSDIKAVDSTLLWRDGRFWLFTNVGVDGAPTIDELFVFSSESLDGAWEPHPLNPVVSDVRRARPAGRIFELDGRMIRPSQDCSSRYGAAIVLNEIRELNRTSYVELPFGRMGPEWLDRNLASHTYNFSSTYEVVDGLVSRRK